MLQIASGKLFTRGIGWTNEIRGVLYTNGYFGSTDLETAAGSFRGTSGERGSLAVVYELTEKMEAEEKGPGVLVSSGATPYLRDFSVIASFFLEILVATDVDIVRRLTNEATGFAANSPPKNFVSGVFERQILIPQDKGEGFTEFVSQLLDLERKYFLAAMRAMKTYVAALHSIPNDPGLSYTLFVSSVETLVQDFDGFTPEWSDIDKRKRSLVDRALEDASDKISSAVRSAILEGEHHAMSRRYRDYVLSKIDGAYFREPSLKVDSVIARYQLQKSLQQAYAIRSQYIHSARPLPDNVANPHGHREVVDVDRRPVLTIQGLARLSRHVIRSFVMESPKVPVQEYDYHLERSGIVVMAMAPQYWVWKPLGDDCAARTRLEGLLSQLSNIDMRVKSAQLSDLREMLKDVESLLPQARKENKPPLYVLYVIFNSVVTEDNKSPNWKSFLEKHAQIAEAPSSDVLIGRTILGSTEGWSLSVHEEAFSIYWHERTRKTGLRAPRLYEAAAALALAERFRNGGQHERAIELVTQAVECHPGHIGLREFESGYSPEAYINWRDILIGEAEGMEEIN